MCWGLHALDPGRAARSPLQIRPPSPPQHPPPFFLLSSSGAGGYCPHGLVEAGQVNTMLGEMLGQDVAYTVEPGASEDEVIFILPGDDAGSPVAARLVTTACFSSAWILNDTLWVWDDLADIPALSSAQAFPTVPQDDLFHAAADCGQQDDVVQLTAAGGGDARPRPRPGLRGRGPVGRRHRRHRRRLGGRRRGAAGAGIHPAPSPTPAARPAPAPSREELDRVGGRGGQPVPEIVAGHAPGPQGRRLGQGRPRRVQPRSK